MNSRTSWSQWWNQSAGPREVLAIAWPLMLSTGLFSLTLFVDRMFLYWYSDDAASAAMSAGTLFWAMICVPTGMIGYSSTFVSQYLGVGRLDRGIRVVIQGAIVAVVLGPFFFLMGAYIPDLFHLFGHAQSLIDSESEYFRWMVPGAWAMVIGASMTGFFAGIGRTRVLLICDAVATLVNVILDGVLIFGIVGMPRMGVQGAAIASSISLIVKLVMLCWITRRYWLSERGTAEPSHSLRGASTWFDAALMWRLIRFGWPAGMQSLAETISFSIIMLLVGRLGSLSMAATTLALGVNIIAFVPINGLGIAVSVLVGQHLTGGNLILAQRAVRSGLWIAGIYACFFALLYGVFPDAVLDIYSLGADPERFDEMRPILRPLLYIIAGYCVIDAWQIVFVSAIKGAGDTNFVLIASVVIGIVVVGLGKLLGDRWNGGLYWWWGVIFAWVTLMAVVFSARYFQGRWKTMRVIEHDLKAEPS